MNRRKYHHQKLPKAWQKKKKPLTLRSQNSTNTPRQTKVKTVKRNKLLAKKPSAWKIPSLLFLSSAVMMILVIPSLIVLPDKHEEKSQVSADKKEDQEAANEPNESVNLDGEDSPFSVEVTRASSDEVDDVPLETYVSRVVASEMPIEFEKEALKAQALAARTYVVDVMMHNDEEDDDATPITDTTDNQVYHDEDQLKEQWGKDYEKNMQKINQAVAETKGEILTYDDNPIFPAFFSTSNGYTENSEDYWENEVPYLRSVDSQWDEQSPKFLDQQVVSIDEAEEELGVQISGELDTEVSRTDGDRIQKLTIGGEEFSGKDIRETFDLRSSDFTVEQKNDHLIFKTKGFGHGIGMSQYGANGMAKDGKSYKEIVEHYYQDIDIEKVTETAPTLVAK